MQTTQNPSSNDFSLKETSPILAGGRTTGGATAFDLVEQMDYLYVRVVKAKELPNKNVNDNPYVEVKLGNFRAVTRHSSEKNHPEWNQVFAFTKDRIQTIFLEIFVKHKGLKNDDEFNGKVVFELYEIPKRVPPDSPLAPQWYTLENQNGHKAKGELMLAVWLGTQADEAFSDAWLSDAAAVTGDNMASTRSKVYLSPKLWYLRVNIIEAQDLQPSDKSRPPEMSVKVVVGNVSMKTSSSQCKSVNPMWNEDLMFVVAEPFDEFFSFVVEDKVAIGKGRVSLQSVEKRWQNSNVISRWYNLEKLIGPEQKQEMKIVGRVHMRISLDGGYHVLDELTQYASDLRATARNLNLNKPSIGVLELGILNASGLAAMKIRNDGCGTTDAYCVAKYGQKWIRTRTIVDCCNPKWNEQYRWEVFDPCTVITIGVFDNCHLHGGGGDKDVRIGKVRIRLSMLETNRVYTHSYPLIVIQPTGAKKMGEIQLAIRFSYSSLANMLQMYWQPLLPTMHYLHPLSIYQQNTLRHQATQITAMRLSRAEPPLRKEAVEFMLDVDSHLYSMRKCKSNMCRIEEAVSGIAAFIETMKGICSWKKPVRSVLAHVICLVLILQPRLILTSIMFSILMIGVWNYRTRPRSPPYMDARLSNADVMNEDELDEEFDTFPSSRTADVVKMRYDRMRYIATRFQTVTGDLATMGERFHSIMSWRDPRATALILIFCFVAGIVFMLIPMPVLFIISVFYLLRHPRFRHPLPSLPINFFKRLPAKTDCLL
ncbi:FT-interacting protein 4-like [Impatiens glandulifera]|uniref:FT-interacting protein 4-like n=1 Tax=Impatiens glandulifera TaxID=253017 RepID=UPI001FB16902|nr:FT-interacting protein 4-like [Impatiens glandulifera]